MTTLPFPFPFEGRSLFENQLRNYLRGFPADGLKTASGQADMDGVFESLRQMAGTPDYAYSAMLAARLVAEQLKSSLTDSNVEGFAKHLQFLRRYRTFDHALLHLTKTRAKEALATHCESGGTFADWEGRQNAEVLFGKASKAKHVAPQWGEGWGWQLEHSAPGYQLKQLLGAYLVDPDLLGVMKPSLERALALHHFRGSRVITQLAKECPELLVANGIEHRSLDTAMKNILGRTDWLRHRDVHVANAVYGKNGPAKAYVDGIQDKRQALTRITEKVLSYRPDPRYLEAYLAMVVDLASHLEAQDNDQPIHTVARLLSLPDMVVGLDIEAITEKLSALRLGDETLRTVLKMHELNHLLPDEKAWVQVMLDEGLKKEVLRHFATQYPKEKDRMYKLNELNLLDDRAASRRLMQDVLMNDLGL